MGLFGPSRKAGISDKEWKENHSRLTRVFGWNSAGKRKVEEVDRLMHAHMDPERGSDKTRVVTAEEFEDTLHSLEKDKRITRDEALKVKRAFEQDLRD